MLVLWTLRVLGAVGFGGLGWWVSLNIELSSMDGWGGRDGGFLPWGLVFAASGIIIGGVCNPVSHYRPRPWGG